MSKYPIIKIPILPLGLLNAFLIQGLRGLILVDTGLPGSEKKLESILHQHNWKYSDIKLIIITHAHVDHAGNAARVKSLSGAPVVAHLDDLPYFRREKEMTFCATGWFGKLFLKTGLMHEPYAPFTPDILLKEGEQLLLNEWGVEGRVLHTPGHTEGSLSIILSDQQALVGDLISSGILLGGILLTNKPKQPPFEDDKFLVAQQLQSLVQKGIKHFYMGHGGPLCDYHVKQHVEKLKKS